MERVVLVDTEDVERGVEERHFAHQRGLLHRAVSLFVFNPEGLLLLQKRAAAKSAFAGRWANTCCTHVRPGESVMQTAKRRLAEELRMTATMVRVGGFVYRAEDPESGLVEHEYDHVLVGMSDDEPHPDPAEVAATRWVEPASLDGSVSGPEYAPWLGEALSAFPDLGPPASKA